MNNLGGSDDKSRAEMDSDGSCWRLEVGTRSSDKYVMTKMYPRY